MSKLDKKAFLPVEEEIEEKADGLDLDSNDDLINNKKLLEIVKNYRIDKLTVTHHTKDDTYDVSFSTLSRSEERNQKAMQEAEKQNGMEEANRMEGAEVPPEPEPEPEPQAKPMPMASSNVVVKVSDQLKPKPKPDLKALASKYPRKYLKKMGIMED
jgi:hypothetical protein